MAYEATRNRTEEDERNIQNNADNIRNAADIAIATGNPYAVAIGKAVKIADKISDGKSTEKLGEELNKINKKAPKGKKIQKKLNDINESGAGDIAAKIASKKNGEQSSNEAANKAASNNKDLATQKQNNSAPANQNSTPKTNTNNQPNKTANNKPEQNNNQDNQNNNQDNKTEIKGAGSGNALMKIGIIVFAPFLAIILLFVGLFSAVGNVSEYEDALGANQVAGGSTGGLEDFEPSSEEAKEFYERVNEVKTDYQAKGKNVDILKIVATYHILSTKDNSITYEDMTKGKIEEIADAMFSGNSYSEETFKNNLTTKIFPSYLPYLSDTEYKQLAEDVFDYIDRYYSFIGEEPSTCATLGSCIYEINGIYIPGKGNYKKNIQVKDLKVRLMQCGGNFGSGTWGKPLQGEEEVPFENYVLGVTYQEIGPSASDEAQKAQLVAARSYSLGRPTAMNNSLGKKLEQESNGQWILQLSSCVADQVYCNPDKGCSAMNDGEQHGTVRSGTSYSYKLKDPLSEDHKLRTIASSVQGEVLVNNQSNIYYSSYTQTEQNKFEDLAKQGLNYKQILMQVYGKSGATSIKKMNCNSSGSCSDVSTGSYASWKQCGGTWKDIKMGNGNETICSVGCLVTSISMLLAKSGAPTVIGDLNPGTFVKFLNSKGIISSTGNYTSWSGVTQAAPTFKHKTTIDISGQTKQQKLNKIKELVNQGYYITAEVKGNTGQHWVAIDTVAGNTIVMMDPGSASTDMWAEYDWRNTSTLLVYHVN